MRRHHPGLGHPGFTKPAQPRPVRGRREHLRILVVDRDDDRRDLTCVSVSVLGHRAEEAWDTRGALVALATEAFDVVILDDQMPGFDVLEVTEFLLAASRRARRRPAMVIVSADLDLCRGWRCSGPAPSRSSAAPSASPPSTASSPASTERCRPEGWQPLPVSPSDTPGTALTLPSASKRARRDERKTACFR